MENLLLDNELIGELIVDLNGNYVVQKAIAAASESRYNDILARISENLHLLETVSFGSKLSQKLLTLYPELRSTIRKSKYESINQQYLLEVRNSNQGKQLNMKERNNNFYGQNYNYEQKVSQNHTIPQKKNPKQANKQTNLNKP